MQATAAQIDNGDATLGGNGAFQVLATPPPTARNVDVVQIHAAGTNLGIPDAGSAEVVVEPQAGAGAVVQARAAELQALPSIPQKPGLAAMRECVTLYITPKREGAAAKYIINEATTIVEAESGSAAIVKMVIAAAGWQEQILRP